MGCQGRISYGGALESIVLHEEIESGKINMPQPKPLMGRDTKTPYVILADEAFVLTTRVMKPFSGVHKIGLKKKKSVKLQDESCPKNCGKCSGYFVSHFLSFKKTSFSRAEKSTKCGHGSCISSHFFKKNQIIEKYVHAAKHFQH